MAQPRPRRRRPLLQSARQAGVAGSGALVRPGWAVR